MGKSCVLIEPGRHLGGLSSSGLGRTDADDTAVIGGLAREFYPAVYHDILDYTARVLVASAVRNGLVFPRIDDCIIIDEWQTRREFRESTTIGCAS